MKASEFRNLIREEVRKVLTEASAPGLKRKDKDEGSITRHFRAYKGSELYQAVEELESMIRDLSSGNNVSLDDIADIVLDIKDAAYDEGRQDASGEF